jgi:hypothetical protein
VPPQRQTPVRSSYFAGRSRGFFVRWHTVAANSQRAYSIFFLNYSVMKRNGDIAPLFQKQAANKAAAVAEVHLEEHTRDFHVFKEA